MIRPYRDTDLGELLEAWYTASLLAHHFFDEAFFQREQKTIQEVHLPKAKTSVYEHEGVVVGFIAMIENEVGAILVDPKYHGRGFGRALMDQVRGLHDAIELDVFKDNAVGREFYKKYGFQQIDEQVHEETGFMQLRLRLTG